MYIQHTDIATSIDINRHIDIDVDKSTKVVELEGQIYIQIKLLTLISM